MTGAPRWIDNHCHLPAGPQGAPLVEEARLAGVHALIDVGTDASSSRQAAENASAFAHVWATAGVHPHDAVEGVDGIVALLDHPRVVAVGEAGLDYHYDRSPRAVQRDVFAAQVALANERDLPLVVHTREAWPDTFAVLDAEGVPKRTVFHCFTGGPDEARACLDRGGFISISGIVTFKSANDLRAAVALTPLDRLLVETDSPYLAPVPHRGKPNRPALLPVVGAAVAAVKGQAVGSIRLCTWMNAVKFYDIPMP